MKKLFTLIFAITLAIVSFSQSTPTMRQVASAGTAITRLPSTLASSVSATADTIMIFQSSTWKKTTPSILIGGTGWSILGNSGTVDGTNFIGTTDNIPFNIRVNNQKAGRIDNTLFNVFLGYQAGNVNSGANNTGVGHLSLLSNTTGALNAAFGRGTLNSNTTGSSNSAFGYLALSNNIGGSDNTGVGSSALSTNSSGVQNSALGMNSLSSNTTGVHSTAIGFEALLGNTTGSSNVGVGYQAGYANISGSKNVFLGDSAGFAWLGSNRLFIGNTTSPYAFTGDFSTGNFGIGTGTVTPGALLDLGLAGTTKGVVRVAGNTSGNITVQPAAAAGTWTWTLPTDDGTSNQFLQTNGSGVTTWATALTSTPTLAQVLTTGRDADATANINDNSSNLSIGIGSRRLVASNGSTINLDWSARTLSNTKWDYAANYGASFVARSLVDKGYVDSVKTTVGSTFTNGSVIFANGTALAQDNANFFWDDSNNRLGIGTTSPVAKISAIGSGSVATTFAGEFRNVNGDTLLQIGDAGNVKLGGVRSVISNMSIFGSQPSISLRRLGATTYRWDISTNTSPNALSFSDNAGLRYNFLDGQINCYGSGSYAGIFFDGASTANWVVQTSSTGLETYSYSAANIVARTELDGDYSIGNPAATAAARLHVKGSTSDASANCILGEAADGSDRLVVVNDGRLYGNALHNNSGSVTGTTNQYIASGTYTFTATDSANTSANTTYEAQWMRVGNVVTVSGVIDVDPTVTVTSTILKFPPPIASNFTATSDCRGTANAEAIDSQSAAILCTTAYAVSDFVLMKWNATDVTNQPMSYTYTYEVK